VAGWSTATGPLATTGPPVAQAESIAMAEPTNKIRFIQFPLG
jgi:hypothetical protein